MNSNPPFAGERRIRVHTLCLPVASNIIHNANQQCIVGLLAKMGVDRVLSSAISDTREAFTNIFDSELTTVIPSWRALSRCW
jgi:hypothetical protein